MKEPNEQNNEQESRREDKTLDTGSAPSVLDLIAQLHSVPAPSPFEHGDMVMTIPHPKKIQLLSGVRIDTFMHPDQVPTSILPGERTQKGPTPVTLMSLALKK